MTFTHLPRVLLLLCGFCLSFICHAEVTDRVSLNDSMEVLARPAGESPEAVSRIETGWSSTYEFKKSHRWNGKDELWYRIKISKESVQQFQVPVMVLPFVIQALVVYASERDVYSWGRFESDGRVGFKGYPIHMIPLNNINLDSPLYLRVGSGGANVGLIDGAFLGESATVRESYFWLGLPNLALWVLAMLIGFMSLFLYTATRENKTLLAYGLFALTIGTFVGSHSYTLRLATDWAKIRHSTELLSLYLSGLTFSLYLDTIFSAIDRFRILNKSWKFYGVFALAAALGELTQWAPLFKWLRTWQLVTVMIFLTVPYFTIRSMLSRSVESYFVGGGLMAFTLASFAGVVFSVGGGAVTAPIFHIFIITGVFLLLIGLGGLLVYRHYDTNRKVIQYQRETAVIREAQARQEKDMEAARAVQQTLLPPALNFPGFETTAHWSTAEQTGGDWYTGYYDEKSQFAYLFLGDVTGHGFASALVTGLAHGAVASVFNLNEGDSSVGPEELLKRSARAVNHIVHESASRSVRAMSMVCLAMNSVTGQILMINCGHPQVYLIKQDKVDVLVGSGPLLGFHAQTEFELHEFQMSPGDRLFVYTDGVLENGRSSGRGISFAKLKRTLRQPKKTVEQTQSDVLQLLRTTWQDAPVEDDYTLVLMQWGRLV